jgi:hypothetical protein
MIYFDHLIVSGGYSSVEVGKYADEIVKKHVVVHATNNRDVDAEEAQEKFVLPDGSTVDIGRVRYECGETMFRAGKNNAAKLVADAINQCPMDCRRDLSNNIIMSGGPSLCRNFSERLQFGIKQLLPSTLKIRTVAPPERLYSVWIGGSILGSLSSSEWMKKAHYDEVGSNLARRDYWMDSQTKADYMNTFGENVYSLLSYTIYSTCFSLFTIVLDTCDDVYRRSAKQ